MTEEFIWKDKNPENKETKNMFSSLSHHLGTYISSLWLGEGTEGVSSSERHHLVEARDFASKLLGNLKNESLVSSLQRLLTMIDNIDTKLRPDATTLDQLHEALEEVENVRRLSTN